MSASRQFRIPFLVKCSCYLIAVDLFSLYFTALLCVYRSGYLFDRHLPALLSIFGGLELSRRFQPSGNSQMAGVEKVMRQFRKHSICRIPSHVKQAQRLVGKRPPRTIGYFRRHVLRARMFVEPTVHEQKIRAECGHFPFSSAVSVCPHTTAVLQVPHSVTNLLKARREHFVRLVGEILAISLGELPHQGTLGIKAE